MTNLRRSPLLEVYMARPPDVSKFPKSITKAVPGLSVGFNDPDTWISTGNYTTQ